MSKNIKEIVAQFQKARNEREEIRRLYRQRYQSIVGGVREQKRQYNERVWIRSDEKGGEPLDRQQNELLLQNKALKEQLIEIQTKQKQRMEFMNSSIQQIKNQYTIQIEQVLKSAQQSKAAASQKLLKYKELIPAIEAKNKQLEDINASMQKQMRETNVLAGKYATEIKQQYTKKIKQIEQIYLKSQQKIQTFHKAFNEAAFIETTLKNEQLLKGIQQNAQKASQAEDLIGEYNQLLKGKTEILNSIRKANEMKEDELKKMVAVEVKIKEMIDSMHADRDKIVEENRKMAEQLTQIKQILTAAFESQNQ